MRIQFTIWRLKERLSYKRRRVSMSLMITQWNFMETSRIMSYISWTNASSLVDATVRSANVTLHFPPLRANVFLYPVYGQNDRNLRITLIYCPWKMFQLPKVANWSLHPGRNISAFSHDNCMCRWPLPLPSSPLPVCVRSPFPPSFVGHRNKCKIFMRVRTA